MKLPLNLIVGSNAHQKDLRHRQQIHSSQTSMTGGGVKLRRNNYKRQKENVSLHNDGELT